MKSTNHALTNHLLGLLCERNKSIKRMMHRALLGTLAFRVEMWKDFVEDMKFKEQMLPKSVELKMSARSCDVSAA